MNEQLAQYIVTLSKLAISISVCYTYLLITHRY